MANFKITQAEKTRINDIDYGKLGFGLYFSDHVFEANYRDNKWQEPEIKPYGPMPVEPGMCTLHYGQSIFEGLKAFPTKDGANLFRPEMNAKRLNRSAERVCIPQFDEALLVEGIKELVKTDKKFIPQKRGEALYIRPVAYGSSNFLGVHASSEYKLIVMTSPVASYYKEGLNPIRILVEDKYVRAVEGGLGSAKTAANYAASLKAGEEAKKKGYAQVLWLDALTRGMIDEVGAMNIMFVIDDELVTPPLDKGTILAGVTRNSVLHLAREWGMKVSERELKINELVDYAHQGKLQEAFGTGTAAVISPVGLFHYKGEDIIINDQKIGPVAQKFYDTITGIQYGEIEDKFGWITKVEF
ncbi:MAG: branched-chain amino acid aminotransferase [Candidatus Kapaibacterium sp.]